MPARVNSLPFNPIYRLSKSSQVAALCCFLISTEYAGTPHEFPHDVHPRINWQCNLLQQQ